LDTSGLYEAGDRRAPQHRHAALAFQALTRDARQLVTTEIVLSETHAMILRRVGPDAALAFIRRVVETTRIEVVPVDAALRSEAVALLAKRPGRHYSLADAISFAVMRTRGITQAFTLDADFIAEGFEVLPALDR
jgi:predicted nucleic acid-binding protein